MIRQLIGLSEGRGEGLILLGNIMYIFVYISQIHIQSYWVSNSNKKLLTWSQLDCLIHHAVLGISAKLSLVRGVMQEVWCKLKTIQNGSQTSWSLQRKLASFRPISSTVCDRFHSMFADLLDWCKEIFFGNEKLLLPLAIAWHPDRKRYVFSFNLLYGFVLWENRSPGGQLNLKHNLSMELLLVEIWISCHSLNKQRPITVLSTPMLRI